MCLLLHTNCGTILVGPTKQIYFTSNPAKAKVFIDGHEKGETPVLIELYRKVGKPKDPQTGKVAYDVRIECEGYETYETKLIRRVNTLILVSNIISVPFGTIGGTIADFSNGSIYNFKEKAVSCDLQKSPDAQPPTTQENEEIENK